MKHKLLIEVETDLDAAETARLVNDLLNIGIEDARITVYEGDDESPDAEAVLEMTISDPVVI